MKKILLSLFLCVPFLCLHAESNSSNELNIDKNQTSIFAIEDFLVKKKLLEAKRLAKKIEQQKRIQKQKRIEEQKRLYLHITNLLEKKKTIDELLAGDNIWVSQYIPYETYKNFNIKLQNLADKVKVYKDKKKLSKSEKLELKILEEEYKIVSGKIAQLGEYRSNPFSALIKPIQLEEEPKITNPLDIITALSYQKHLKKLEQENTQKYASLSHAMEQIHKKKILLQELVLLSNNKKYLESLAKVKIRVKDFELAQAVFKTSVDTFSQKVTQLNSNIDKEIEGEVKRSIVTGIIILILLLLFILVKYLVRKYMSDNDLFYGINKVVNFVFIFLIFLIILLTYLENVENLMTILSFASAGIAIALKDWFMSLLGWVVILVSGSIHVGDRVKFVKDGVEYVGDIVDISMLRMTLHEDVTLTTIMLNKRSGRIIFIPNNYIFTDMVANYSHAGLKTVWDGAEFIVTFDSNITKAQSIAKEVTRKYSKGYTDMTRKQLNRLRSKYSVRNTGVEPRIFTVFEPYGMRVSAWYLTNSYATLTLRTTISVEILRLINEADDIHLALPSQSLYMNESLENRLSLKEGDEPSENHKA